MVDLVITARLDLIAAKAKILAESYKNNKLWGGELKDGIDEIEREIALIRRGEPGAARGWSQEDR